MASIKDLYDKDIVQAVLDREGSGNTIEEREAARKELSPFTVTVKEGELKFSEVFWEPTNIPDIPIRKFKAEDWPEEGRYHIPEADPNWVWNKDATERFALAMYCGDTTLLHGLQGTGKSELPRQWCAYFKIPFWRMNCNKETREGHFLGSPGVEYDKEGKMYIKQEPTALTDSLKYGGIFCEDEAFRHNSGLVLQSLREKNSRFILLPDAPGRSSSDRKLQAPEGKWWYVLTDNTCGLGDETGTFDAEVQDVSTLDRIGATIEVNYLSKADEINILSNHSKLNDQIKKDMVDLANMVRNAFKQQQILTTMSVRGLLSWAEKIQITGKIGFSLKLVWYDKLSKDDQAVVKDIYHQIFAKNIEES